MPPKKRTTAALAAAARKSAGIAPSYRTTAKPGYLARKQKKLAKD